MIPFDDESPYYGDASYFDECAVCGGTLGVDGVCDACEDDDYDPDIESDDDYLDDEDESEDDEEDDDA